MLENSCRVCLTAAEKNLIDLFSIDDETETFANKLNFCCGIEPFEDDQLPQKICLSCLEKLRTACELKKRCIDTDALLRSVVAKVEENQEPSNSDTADVLNFEIAEPAESFPDEEFTEEFLDFEDTPPKRKRKSFKKTFYKVPEVEQESGRGSQKPTVHDLTCVFCDEVFTTRFKKNAHLRSQHSDELFCTVCKKPKTSVISTAKCLKRHKLGIAWSILCQICGRVFNHKKNLAGHLETVHSESQVEIFACDICGVKTKYKPNIQRHMRSVHLNDESTRYPCPHDSCTGLSYTTKLALNFHLYGIHNVTPPFSCEVCGAGFTFVSELKFHKQKCKHNRLKSKLRSETFFEEIDGRFHCKVCSKSFDKKLNSSQHFSQHHQAKKTCEICDKDFASSTSYRRHMKAVHEKVRNFHCTHLGCGKSFNAKAVLANHKNSHTGEKPFACSLCNFRSGDRSTVSKHRKKLHAQELVQQSN